MTQVKEIVVDARGHRCPTPTLRLQRALRNASPGQRVRLLADDPLARIDVPHFLSSTPFVLVETSASDGGLSFVVERPSWPGPERS